MSHYSDNPAHVRVSRFKPSGKWYDDFMLDMSGEYNTDLIHTAVDNAWLKVHKPLEDGWMLVVLEPYHIHSHPVMLTGGRDYS